ncbi:MAG: hypothetical protein LBB24_01985 [Rickettsiales bacterium]|nr:hypothetical protein [Rickettsiales bacterium]
MARISSTLGNVEIRPLLRVKRYLLVYSAFILATVFPKTPGIPSRLAWFLPDINIMLVFFVFFWSKGREMLVSKNNLFFFGLIVDTVGFLPMGLSSVSFLVSFKIMSKVRQYSIESDSMVYFLSNILFYMFLFMFLQWLIYSVSRNDFHPFLYLIIAMFKNTLFSVLTYPLWKKYKNV